MWMPPKCGEGYRVTAVLDGGRKVMVKALAMTHIPTEVENGSVLVGFSLDIKSDTLAAYLTQRADHHGKRATLYNEKIGEISKLKNADDEETEMIGKMSNNSDPVDSLRKSARKHGKRARFFRFASEHIAKGRTYRLTQSDLQSLEIYPTGF